MALPIRSIDPSLAALMKPASELEHDLGRRRLATGLAALDAGLGGGWPAATLSELAGRRSAGRTSVLHASLAAAMAREQAVALVDVDGAFDPRSAEAAGVVLARLLWIRAAAPLALRAADVLIAAGGFGLVAIDLGERPPRAPTAAWLRLRHAAERQGTAVLVIAPARLAGAAAAAAVVLHGARPDFVTAAGPLLASLTTHIDVVRRAGHAPPRAPANEQTLCFAARDTTRPSPSR